MIVEFLPGCMYRNTDVGGRRAHVLTEYNPKKSTVVVCSSFWKSDSKGRAHVVVPSENHFRIVDATDFAYDISAAASTKPVEQMEGDLENETEEQAIERIRDRFGILGRLTEGVATGCIRSLFVKGAPGCGKSFGVQAVLDDYNLMNRMGGTKDAYDIVKGTASPVAMFVKLFSCSDENQTIVFDDADGIFFDDQCLNMLKAVTDTSRKRRVSYNTASKFLEEMGVPNEFEFKGSVIFITNLDLNQTQSYKIKPHIEALMDRSISLDLTINTMRDRFLRVKDVMLNSNMLQKFKLTDIQTSNIMEFLRTHHSSLKLGVSLRTVISLAELMAFSKDESEFKKLATVTMLKGM